jgi:hypothetical protein
VIPITALPLPPIEILFMSEEKQNPDTALDDTALEQISGGVGLQVDAINYKQTTDTGIRAFKHVEGLKSETEVIE